MKNSVQKQKRITITTFLFEKKTQKISIIAFLFAIYTIPVHAQWNTNPNDSNEIYYGTSYSKKVGVGTDNPNAQLHVKGTSMFSLPRRIGFPNFLVESYRIGSGTSTDFVVNSFGNVGIGSRNPFQKLSVIDGQLFLGRSTINQFESGRIRFSERDDSFQGGYIHYDGDNNIFNIGVNNVDDSNTSSDRNAISIKRNNGSVGIGTNNFPSGYKLAVDGKAICEELTVQLSSDWPDYVFKKDYDLPSLSQVEQHIEENGHLQNIPSAQEIAKNGIQLSKMNAKLLQKIEELTLYTIQQEKRIETLEKNTNSNK